MSDLRENIRRLAEKYDGLSREHAHDARKMLGLGPGDASHAYGKAEAFLIAAIELGKALDSEEESDDAEL